MSFTEDDLRSLLAERSTPACPSPELRARAQRGGRRLLARRTGLTAAGGVAVAVAVAVSITLPSTLGDRHTGGTVRAAAPAASPITLVPARSTLSGAPRIAGAQWAYSARRIAAVSFVPRSHDTEFEIVCQGPTGTWMLSRTNDSGSYVAEPCDAKDGPAIDRDSAASQQTEGVVPGRRTTIEVAIFPPSVTMVTDDTAADSRLLDDAATQPELPTLSGSWAVGVYDDTSTTPMATAP